jgi:hypothetical protein
VNNLIQKLFENGKLAKQTTDTKKKNKIILEMAEICHLLRAIEPEVKAVYPQMDEIFNLLLAYKSK